MVGSRKVLKAQASSVKLSQCLVSTPLTILSAAKQAPIASWGVPYDWLTEEERTRAWFTEGSAPHVGTTQKWTAAGSET